MEALVVATVGLVGLYSIAEQDKKRKVREKFSSRPSISASKNYLLKPDEVSMVNDVNRYNNSSTETNKYISQAKLKNQETRQASALNESAPASSVATATHSFVSMSGNEINQNEFRHNNMTPYYGAKIRGRTNTENATESVLDNMVGSGSQAIKKSEQGSLFTPVENVQWTTGAPNTTEFMLSRQNPGMYKSNTKPWEEERVGPGLNAGFGVNGTGGFNSGMASREAWMPKTVDELRVSTNPKPSFILNGHGGPANSSIKNLGSHGILEKNQPDTYFINGPERYLRTTGSEKRQTVRSEHVIPEVQRTNTSVEYAGVPSGGTHAPKNREEHDKPLRQELFYSSFGMPNRTQNAPVAENKMERSSYSNLENNRTTSYADRFGNIGGASGVVGAVVAPLMDILKPSRKENVIGNFRESGNVQRIGAGGVRLYNPDDKLKKTNKETTIEPKFHMNFNGVQQGPGAYSVVEHQFTTNHRDTTTYSDYGNPGSSLGGFHNNVSQYNQRNNDKRQTLGWVNSGVSASFNNDINQRTFNSRDEDNVNQRHTIIQSQVMNKPPDISMGGEVNMPQYIENTQNSERLHPEMLDAFKKNPFTQSLQSVA